MTNHAIESFRLTRFEFGRDRVIGDSQVRFKTLHAFALELTDEVGRTGLGFAHSLWDPMPSLAALEETFRRQVWPKLRGTVPQASIHRVSRLRGGNQRDIDYGFGEALQVATWDLAAQQAGVALATYLGAGRNSVRAYASGLDYHLTDTEFAAFFAHAANCGFDTFKIKVGHPDAEWDLSRLELLRQTVGKRAGVMIDANEAWTPKQAAMRLDLFRRAGHDFIWVEDPILRSDIEGLKALSAAAPWTQINSGEYLDVSRRTDLLMARGCDIINLHGRLTEVMRVGWLAAELGLQVALGNTMLETGIHAACALPGVEWLEYSFQNYDHLVEAPVPIRDGIAYVPEGTGLGLTLSDQARTVWSQPTPLSSAPAIAPPCRFISTPAAFA